MNRTRVAAAITLAAVTGLGGPAAAARPTPGPSITVGLTVTPDCTFTATATWSGYDVRYAWMSLLGQQIQISGKHISVLHTDSNGVDATSHISGNGTWWTWTTGPVSSTNRFYASVTLFDHDPALDQRALGQAWSPAVLTRCALPPPN